MFKEILQTIACVLAAPWIMVFLFKYIGFVMNVLDYKVRLW